MKLQIDTEKKTIKVEGTVNFDALIKNIKKLFPENEWKEYSLESNTTITYWNSPIIYPTVQPYYYDWQCKVNPCYVAGTVNALTTGVASGGNTSVLVNATTDTVNYSTGVASGVSVFCIEFEN